MIHTGEGGEDSAFFIIIKYLQTCKRCLTMIEIESLPIGDLISKGGVV